MRREAVQFAREQGVEDEILADVALAVSEAATNSVLHAFLDRDPGSLCVVIEPGRDMLVVRVIDDGRGMQPRSDSPGLGLGLPTLARLTARLDIREGADGEGTEVCMTFAVPGLSGGAVDEDEGTREHDRLRLLGEVSRLAEGGAWPSEGVDRLLDLLVPAIADACAFDVVDLDGRPRRVAVRLAEPISPGLARWLDGRPPARAGSAEAEAISGEDATLFDLTPDALDELAHDPVDREMMSSTGLRWWIVVGMGPDASLGRLGFGLRPSRGRPDDDLIDFLTLIAERAAAALADRQLIADLERTRHRLEQILGALAEAVTVHDEFNQILYANEAAVGLLGASSVDEVLAARPGELAARFTITREDGSPVGVDDLPGPRLLAGDADEVAPMLTRSVERTTGRARWLLTKTTLLAGDENLVVNVIEDVTDAKDAERRQRFLAQAGEALVSSLDYARTLDAVARLAVPDFADWCAFDVVGDDDDLRRVALVHRDPEKVVAGCELLGRSEAVRAATEAALREGRAIHCPEVTDDMEAEHHELMRSLGIHSLAMVPMRVGERLIGALTLATSDSARRLDEADMQFAEEVARRAAVAVENARLYSQLTG